MKPKLTLPKQVPSLEDLKHTNNCIQLNSRSIPQAALEELMIHRRAKNLVQDLGRFYHNVSDYLDSKIIGFANRKIDIKPAKIEEILNNKPYTSLVDVMVPTVPGMSVDWVTMVEALELASVPANELYDRTLYPFAQFIGVILNNPEKLKSSSLRPEIVMHDVEAIKTKLGRCLTNGNRDAFRYGKVFRRNGDVLEVDARLHKLVELHKQTNVSLIVDKVKELDANLDLLMKKIQDPNEPYRMTPQKIQELSQICFALATEITAYSVYTNLLESAVNAMNLTVTQLQKA